MPAHIKGALTQTHLSIPIMDGKLALGAWQGVFSGNTDTARARAGSS